MFELLKKRIKNEKGLSLVELLAVIVILGIVAAIAVPAIGNIIENSRYNAAKSDAINVLNAANLYFTDINASNGAKVAVSKLKSDGYLESEGTIPTATEVTKAAGGSAITATVKFSGDKSVTLTAATITSINADKQKGSAATINAITATPATP